MKSLVLGLVVGSLALSAVAQVATPTPTPVQVPAPTPPPAAAAQPPAILGTVYNRASHESIVSICAVPAANNGCDAFTLKRFVGNQPSHDNPSLMIANYEDLAEGFVFKKVPADFAKEYRNLRQAGGVIPTGKEYIQNNLNPAELVDFTAEVWEGSTPVAVKIPVSILSGVADVLSDAAALALLPADELLNGGIAISTLFASHRTEKAFEVLTGRGGKITLSSRNFNILREILANQVPAQTLLPPQQ